MSTHWLGRAELKYNQMAETLIVRIAIRYYRGQKTLFGDVDSVSLKINLPDGVNIQGVSRITIGSLNNLKKLYVGCGFAQAVDLAENGSDFMTYEIKNNDCVVSFSNVIFNRRFMPSDGLAEIVVLIPLDSESDNGDIKSGKCSLVVSDNKNSKLAEDEIIIRFGRRIIGQVKATKKALNSRINEMMSRPNLLVPPTHSPKELNIDSNKTKLDGVHHFKKINQEEVLSKRMRVLIEDEEGSGKSAFLRQIASLASDKNMPVAYVDCLFLSNEIQNTSMTIPELAMVWLTEIAGYSIVPEGFYDISIGRGEALIIVEGVDALSSISMKRLLTNAESLASSTTCPIIISSRPLPTGTDLLRIERFPYRRKITRLTADDQMEFADSWFSTFPADRRSPKRMLTDFKHLTVDPLVRDQLTTLSGINKICLLMSQREEISNDTADRFEKILLSSLKSLPDILPARLRRELKDRRLVSDLTMSVAVYELFPALSATVYNALLYGESLSRDNIIVALAEHYVADGERGVSQARDTACDMIKICGPSGLGVISFEGGRILPVNRLLIEHFASYDRAIGFQLADHWSKRTAEDGVVYPGSWSIQLKTFHRLLQRRRPKMGFDLLLSLTDQLYKNPNSARVSAMIFGKAIDEAGYLLSSSELRDELFTRFSSELHRVLSKNQNSHMSLQWVPWEGSTKQSAKIVWDACEKKDSFRKLNLALEISELTGYVTSDIYIQYLGLMDEVKQGSATPLPMSIRAKPDASGKSLEYILRLGGGWLLNHQVSTGFDRIWAMPLAYLYESGTLIWEYTGLKIKSIIEWAEKMNVDPWSVVPDNVNPIENLNNLIDNAPRQPLSRFALAICVLVGQIKTLGLEHKKIELPKIKKMEGLVAYLNSYLEEDDTPSAWWKMVEFCKELL